jgi:hypothetical protein
MKQWRSRDTYGNLKVDNFLSKCAHLVVEAEAVLARLVGREDKIALPLLGAVQYDPLLGPNNRIVDIERAARLDLEAASASVCNL